MKILQPAFGTENKPNNADLGLVNLLTKTFPDSPICKRCIDQ